MRRVVFCVGLVACGGDDEVATMLDAAIVDAAPRVDAPAGCERRVGPRVDEHACLHAEHGPFREVVADDDLGAPSVDIDRAHTAFTVILPGPGAAAVAYTARRGGEHTFYRSPDVELRLTHDGTPLPALLDHPVGACSALTSVVTYTLVEGTTYSLVLDGGRAGDVMLVVESLAGWDAAEAHSTSCAPDAATVDAGTADCSPVLGAPVVEHSCLHAEHGPYKTITAQLEPATSAPHVNSAHTHHTVQLIADAGSFRGIVTYRPVQDGEHVFFVQPDVPLVVEGAEGRLPLVSRQAVFRCTGLTTAVVVALEAAVRYRLVFGPTPVAAPGLVIEALESFAEEDRWTYPCAT